MTRDQYASAVSHLFMELFGAISIEEERSLRGVPEFQVELENLLEVTRASDPPADEVLAAACSLVEEYVKARWANVIDGSYRSFAASLPRPRGEGDEAAK